METGSASTFPVCDGKRATLLPVHGMANLRGFIGSQFRFLSFEFRFSSF
jgi:hypothetical protein